MYGIVATLSAPSEETSGDVTNANGQGQGSLEDNNSSSNNNKRIVIRDRDDPSIIKVITTTENGTKVKYFREIKKRDGVVWRPLKPEKPKPAVPTDEREDIRRDPKELIIQ